MRLFLAVASCLAFALPAIAQSERPIRPKASTSEEQRYVGVDFPNWLVVQAIGTTSEPLRIAGTGVPVCVGWEAVVSFNADQRACWCWSLDPNVRVSAPASDGTCRVTDDYGRDGDGACFTAAANETVWSSPAWPIVARRPGSRGYVGSPGGLCTVATSTTQSFGSSYRPACRVTADCTAIVGSGTCEAFSSPVPDLDGRSTSAASRDDQYGRGCAYAVGVLAAAGVAYAGGKR